MQTNIMNENLDNFTDFLDDDIQYSQPISLPSSYNNGPDVQNLIDISNNTATKRPLKFTGECGGLRCIEEIDLKYRSIFSYRYFNLVQSKVLDDALYSDKSMVVCAPTGSGKTVVFEMAIVQLLMEMEDRGGVEDFKIIYMAPIKALCTERLTEWYTKFTKLNLLCIEVTGDTDVEFAQLKPYRIIITTPEKWDMLTRRWRDNKCMVELIKLFLIDEVHILNEPTRGPVLEAVVSRMKTIQTSMQSAHRIEQLQKLNKSFGCELIEKSAPKIRFVAVSATISNPEDVAEWLGSHNKPAVFYKFGDECRPVKLKRVVEGYPCPEGTSIFKFDIILNYKLWPIIQKYHNGKPTLIFCNTRKSVLLTAETLSKEITINFSPEQRAKLVAVSSSIKNKKVQSLVVCGVGCHHAGLLFEERTSIELAFRKGDLPILITTTTLAMGVNLPAHLVIIKNTQQYVNGAYQEYSISTVLQMVGRAGRPQFDSEATAVIMTRLADKGRYQALVGGCEPLQSYLHKRLAENLNSEAALSTVNDVAQCVQWLRSTFLFVRAARDPKKYLGLPQSAAPHLISKKIEELCVKAMNGLASSGLITMDEASCIESTEAGRLMSIYYLDLETMKHIMKISGDESLEQLLWIVCECHELSDMHLRVDERRCLNSLNRNNSAPTIRYPMKGKITTRQMKLNCIIQAVLGCLPIHEPSLNQEALKVMRIADRICKCMVSYVTRPNQIVGSPRNYKAVLNCVLLAKCIESHLWENSVYVSKQLRGIGPTFSMLLATAGKSNFLLLEESHPRDLERIMNKGPPAGNILRKQISLLPKYQITITSDDVNTVKVQLNLLNQMYLAENMEHLTAGGNHKCYIIIGDTENCLLLLTSFKDKDLIGIYNGQITLYITKKHDIEHRIIAHCISANFAGIDSHCEYQFNRPIAHSSKCANTSSQESKPKSKLVKQSAITDTFKVRKRKNFEEGKMLEDKKTCNYFTEEKEQPKRQIKDAHCPTINNDIHFSRNVQFPLKELNISDNSMLENLKQQFITIPKFKVNSNVDKENDDDNHINSILNEIEKEIYGSEKLDVDPNTEITKKNKIVPIKKYNDRIEFGQKYQKIEKSNYNFIDTLDKKYNCNNTEEVISNNKNTFVDSVKSYIDVFLEKTKQKTTSLIDNNIENVVEMINKTDPAYINIENSTKTEKPISLLHKLNDDIKEVVTELPNSDKTIKEPSSYNILHFDTYDNDEISKEYNKLEAIFDNNNLNNLQSLSNKQTEIIIPKNITNQTTKCCNTVIQKLLNKIDVFRSSNEYSSSAEFREQSYTTKNSSARISYNTITQNSDKDVKNIATTLNKLESPLNTPTPNTSPVNQSIVKQFSTTLQNTIKDSSELVKSDKISTQSRLDLLKSVDSKVQTGSNCLMATKSYYISPPNISSYISSPNCSTPNCTQKISYTKTQVNIYTQNNLERNYCVMSQLKLDFDIIGTKQYSLKPNKNNFELKLKPDNENSIELGTPLISLCYKANQNYEENNMNKINAEENTKVSALKEITDGQNIEPNKEVIELNTEETDGNKEEKGLINGKYLNLQLDNKTDCLMDGIKQKNRTIDDIIEKYKNIISSKSNDLRESDYPIPFTSNNKELKRDKIKRPFKITDLPSVHEPNREFPISQPILLSSQARKDENNDNKGTIKVNNQNFDIPLSVENLLDEQKKINDDIDMSQNMLDPKTFLECYKEEVIPPPSEFRDDNWSNSRIFGIESSSNNNQNTVREFSDEGNNALDQGKMETWILKNDDNKMSRTSFNIMKSNRFNNVRTQATVRKAKLNEFKFSRKNIFKHKK